MNITLNGNIYELADGTGVKRQPVTEWPDNIRLDGQQQRKDRRLMSSWVINDWSAGLGIKEVKVGIADNLRRFWDAENIDTRYANQLTLSPLFNTCTIVPSRGDLSHAIDYQGNVYFVESQRVVDIGTLHYGFDYYDIHPKAYLFTPPFTIGSLSTLGKTGICGSPSDYAKATVGSLCGIYTDGARIIHFLRANFWEYDSNAARWMATGNGLHAFITHGIGSKTVATSPYMSPPYVGNSDVTRDIQVSDLQGTLHYIFDQENVVNFGIADGNNWSVHSKVASIPMPVGTQYAELVNDGLTMYAVLPNGVYDFDNTPQIAVDTKRTSDKNCAAALYRNLLYFKNKKSIIEYDSINLNEIGFDRDDGIETDKTGEPTAFVSSWQYLFAAVKGATYSHILAMDAGYRWHYYARIPTAGLWVKKMFLSDSPDSIDRLWVIFGNYGYPGYFLNPLVNPLYAGTYAFEQTGHITFPIYGGDLPEEDGAFYNMKTTIDALGGSNMVLVNYGLNGEPPTSTLGLIATTSKTLTFGSPYGLQAERIQPKFTFFRGATGTTPVFKQAVIHYLKDPEKREEFQFTIDINKTSTNHSRPLECVIGSLNAELNSRILMPFHYGQISTKNVKVIAMPFEEQVNDQRMYEGERDGLVTIGVAEIA